jgi:UDP-GlcNAc:undecaprenyl-phosphate GlcNAc-1-phosphate transferase
VLSYLLVFGVSAVVTLLVTPVVRLAALRLGWIDRPSDRKVHPKPTATAGGLAILAGVGAGIGASRLVPALAAIHEASSDQDAALVAALVIVAVGLLDDVKGLSPLGKLAGQVLAAGVLVLLGVQLLYFYFPGQGTLYLSQDLAVPLTVLWVVGMINAVNLIDGLDGLAAGMVAIAATAFFVYMQHEMGTSSLLTGASTAALLSAVVAGAAVGFLPWNLHPARVFMGDTGAMLLGLLMAVATISGVGQSLSGPSAGDFAVFAIPVAVPLLVLAVPLLDVLLAIFRRVRHGVGIGHADKQHIHHRLLDIGHSHRQAVFLMYVWSALISACALILAFVDGRTLVLGILSGAVVLSAVLPRLVRDRTPHGSDLPRALPSAPQVSPNGNGAAPSVAAGPHRTPPGVGETSPGAGSPQPAGGAEVVAEAPVGPLDPPGLSSPYNQG